jgi:hypothetical protein
MMPGQKRRKLSERKSPREVERLRATDLVVEQPPVTENDIRRVEELIEKYGYQHLRNKP